MPEGGQTKYNLGDWSARDGSSWFGRMGAWFTITAPQKSFMSGPTIRQMNKECKALVAERGDADGNAMLTQEEWADYKYKKSVLAASMTAEDEEPIAWVARMSAFIPTNLPIVAGMLLSAPTPANTVFWQWVCQTYVAALNYGNRNASSPQTTADLVRAYGAACSLGMGIGLGLRMGANKVLAGKTGVAAALASNVVAYFAVMLAGNASVWVMRQAELTQGITLTDVKSGKQFGPSKIAASEAIWATMYSRAVGCCPMFFAAPAFNAVIGAMGLMPKPKTPAATAVELTGIAFGLWLTQPANCAFYPQMREIDVTTLEPEVRAAAEAAGVTHLQYNKGL